MPVYPSAVNPMKGQGSTEYLVILAVVLIVALVVIGLLGEMTGFGMEGLRQQSENYWQGASPFSIVTIKVQGDNVDMEVKNQRTQRLNLTAIYFDGESLGVGSHYFAPGETKLLTGDLDNFSCTMGQPYEFTNVTIRYNQGRVSGITQTGDKPLLGKCS